MKKKIISILLCAMTILSFAGCGNTKTNDSTKDAASVSNTNSNDKKDDSAKKEEPKEESKVLFDDEFAKVTYTGINRDEAVGPEINLEIENKSDKDITIQVRDVSIDGYMTDPIFSSDVLKGKKSKAKIGLLKDKVDKNFKSMEGKFIITEKDDFGNPLKEEPFTINY